MSTIRAIQFVLAAALPSLAFAASAADPVSPGAGVSPCAAGLYGADQTGNDCGSAQAVASIRKPSTPPAIARAITGHAAIPIATHRPDAAPRSTRASKPALTRAACASNNNACDPADVAAARRFDPPGATPKAGQ